MKKATYTILYNRRKKLDRKGNAPVEIRITLGRKSKIIPTGIKILPAEWNEKQKKVKNRHHHFIKYNQVIYSLLHKLEAIELKKITEGKIFQLEQLSNLSKEPEDIYFTAFWERTLNEDRTIKLQTRKNHKTHLSHLKSFKKEIAFSDLNVELLLDFERYLLNYTFKYKGVDKHLGDLAIHTIFRTVKAYTNKAIKYNLIPYTENPFLRFDYSKYDKKKPVRRFLKPDQIRQMEELTLEPGERELEKIRDAFLLACYTGLSSMDVISLSKSQIKYREGEGYSIEMQRGKNGNWFYIPIYKIFNGKAEKIILKYMDPEHEYFFDEFVNQNFNKHLKTIAWRAGIKENVTFHMGRHSCAKYLLDLGLRIEVISKILGHTKLATTQIYASVDKQTIDNELEKIDF